ncbi:MAG: HAD family phosphatase [Oligoflexia bacterium]|nr:HAD family phosphatase [Oligoflexia bacterium]
MKNIIFDFGGVLIDWNPDYLYKKYFANDLIKMNHFYQETEIIKMNIEMDRGRPYDDALTELSTKFPHYQHAVCIWKTRWPEMVAGSIEGTVKILESLYEKNYPLYAITNWSCETFYPYVRNKYKFFDYFKDIVISGHEKVVKPSPKIYEILLQRNQLNPKDCIYIDDNQNNLLPAKDIGISTIHFESAEQLSEQLKSYGI